MKQSRRVHQAPCASTQAVFARHPLAAAVSAALLAATGPAWAQLPAGAAVVSGKAGIVTNGSAMTVTNSPNAIVNWKTFSIGTQNSVRFEQQNAASQVLNRVVGNDPSSILGSLSSNGGVWLVNPHGVLFGQNARIDVGGLVASTLGISNDDFLGGRFRFESTNPSGGQLLNQGQISTTFGGRVWLMGDSVRNEGLIKTPGGNIVLAAGKSIELVDSGMPNLTVRVTAPENEALNLGSLIASGGRIDVHGGIVNQQGIVRADSVATDAAGRVVIKAQGDLLVGGQISATSAEGKGGQIHLLGRNVGLVGQAVVDASGAAGGGEILVGGDYLGSNPDVPNARASFVGDGATLKASATVAGDGGRVIVWGNDATRVYGTIEAKGAGAEGKGGFVETSGGYLDARPKRVDVGAESGQAGTWLLDPNNITIADNDGDVNVTEGPPNFTSTNDNSIVSTSTINSALNTGGIVRIITGNGGTNTQQGNITVADSISKTSDSTASLILLAQGDITINPGVSITSSIAPALNVTLNSNITSFDPDTGVVRFPPADGTGGIIVRGSINAGTIQLESGGTTPGGNHIELEGASLTGTSLVLRAGTFTGTNQVNVAGSRILLGASTITTSDFVRVTAGSVSGQPTVVAGGPIRVFAGPNSGGQIQGGTWTSNTDAGDPAILLNTSAVSGVTLNTPNSRWVVVGSSSPDRYQLQPTYVRVNQPLNLSVDQNFAGLLGPESGVGVHGFVLTTPLNVNIRVNATRPYDGTTAATVSSGQVTPITDWSTLVANFVPQAPVAGTFSDRNAGLNKSVTLPTVVTGAGVVTPFSLTYRNVPVRGATQQFSADITPRQVTASGIAADKVYDGTTAATLLVNQLSPIIAGDNVSVTGSAATFSDKNVGNDKTVTIAGGSLSGTDAGNYQLAGTAATTADITPRPVTASGVTAADKVYDGTRAATVTGSLANVIAGDSVSLSGATGLFDTKNVGAGKLVTVSGGVLAGPDGGNYILTGDPVTANASITPKAISIGITGAVVKEYDATAAATLAASQYALDGAVAGDAITVSGPVQGSYDSANVGTQKLVTATGGFQVAGADAPNYMVGAINLTSANNVVATSASGNVGTVTPATLTYNADPAVRDLGVPVAGLTGNVTGFKGADNVATATSGSLAFVTPANETSPAGTYAIDGTGLAAGNYVFTQAPANATALILQPSNAPAAPQQQALESSTAAVDSAIGTVLAAINPRGSSGGVFDISNPAAANRSFGPVNIAGTGQDELARLLESRREFKRKLFADAIYKLEIDPSLADVQPCANVADAASGLCRITTEQIDDIHAKKARAEPAPVVSARAKAASLPQIERKIAVLFGINDYADKKIPRLENAIPDVEAVSRVFAEKLGYEVRVIRDPDKAGIIRTLNQLSADVNASDSVVVYYAGHGISLEKNGAGYWLPSDAPVNDPTRWISNSDVAKLLAGIRSRQMAVISDSCYSGAFARDGMASVGRDVSPDDVLTKRSVVVLSSGGDEPVSDEGKEGHSIFAWNLMKSIDSVQNWRPGSTIFNEVQVGVRKEFPQSPKYGSVTSAGHQQGGDYLFEQR